MTNQKNSKELGFPMYMVMCATVAAFSGFNVGWHISVPNMPQSVISACSDGTEPISLNAITMISYPLVRGLTVGAFALGGLAGSLATMYMNVWFGRRHNIMIACCWTIVGGILSAVSINTSMYSVGRAFVGIACGMSGSSVAIYVSEISTNKSRGALGSLFELFLNFGLLLAQACGLGMSKVPTWRLLWAIPSILSAIQLVIMFFFTVECPRRLCANKDYDNAFASLQKLRAGADVEEEFEALLAARQREEESGQKRMSVLDIILLKDKKISWNTVIVMVLQAYNQVGGVGPMSVYSVGFFTKIFGGDQSLAQDITLADAAGNILATFIAVIFMHKVGRKGFMVISLAGCTLASVFMVIGSAAGPPEKLGPLVITAAILYTFTYSMGCGVIPWLIAPELLPMHALASGSALGNAANWLCNFVINTLWPTIDNNLGVYSFTVFVGINFVGLVFVVLFMRETTGKDIDGHKAVEKKKDTGIESGTAGSSQTSEHKTDKVEYIEASKH